ncbi:MAG: SIMPL domain-containing protein [Thermoproteota archaeon]|nr:SIMPL domain-containing protein [Thermoproteota archaeon]
MPLNNNDILLEFIVVGLTLLLSGLFACVFFSSNNTAFAQGLNPIQNVTMINAANTLSLTGTASTTVKPDKVTVSLGVETTNKTADAALTANSKIMNQVIDALKSAGIRDNETSTSSFNISPNYNYSQPSSTAGIITGFTVSNTIQIESTNINSTSKWIDTAIAAGANTVDRIDFALSNKNLEETKNNLIKQAMQDARAKADIVAYAAGVKVVGIRSINLNELAIQPPPTPIPMTKQSLAATEARPTPIISGQEEVTTNMNVVFLIQ